MKFWFLNNPNRRWIPRRTWRKVKESREIRPWHASWQRYGTWPRHAGTWSREGEILKYHNQLQLFHIDCIVICIILSRFSKFIHCVQNSNKAFKFEFAIYLVGWRVWKNPFTRKNMLLKCILGHFNPLWDTAGVFKPPP